MVLPVPDGLDPVVATLFNPLGAGIRWGTTVPGTGPGDVVAVLGPGVRGLCAAAAKEAGAGFVMVTGLGPRDADRSARSASTFGADLAVDVAVEDPVAALRKATGTMADVVVDVTARAPAAFAQAIAAGTARRDRRCRRHPRFRHWRSGVFARHGGIQGAAGYRRTRVDVTAYRGALDLLMSGRYPFESLPRRCVRLEDAEELLATMAGERDGVPPVQGVLTP